MAEQKSELTLMPTGGKPVTLEMAVEFYKKLTGREPTEKGLEDMKRILAEQQAKEKA